MIIILSGPSCAGKTTFADMFRQFGFEVLKTSRLLESVALQQTDEGKFNKGADLDKTNPNWLAAYVKTRRNVVVDAVRSESQLQSLMELSCNVFHVRLTAPRSHRVARGIAREAAGGSPCHDFDGLEGACYDCLIDTTRWTLRHQKDLVFHWCRRWTFWHADALIGGQWGSEGKGNIVSRLVQDTSYNWLVRSGGPNAGHTVRFDDSDKKVVFYHLPSGAVHAPTAGLYLAPGAVINPEKLRSEVESVEKATGVPILNRLRIHPYAAVIDADDIEAEQKLVPFNGSTAQGVGAATARRVWRKARCAFQHPFLARYVAEPTVMSGRLLLEGTQGAGLSWYHGPYPYTTSRNTDIAGLASECGVPVNAVRRRIAVFRTFPIRVAGNSGPMPRECDWEDVAELCGVGANVLRERERTTTTKRLRRVSWWDWELFHETLRRNEPTELALTFADYLGEEGAEQLADQMELLSGIPVRYVAHGPRPGDVQRYTEGFAC